MKKIFISFLVTIPLIAFSQASASCNYSFGNPLSGNFGTQINTGVFAIDLNIPPNTKVDFTEFEDYIAMFSNDPVNQAIIYLYEDDGGKPGQLIFSSTLPATSTLTAYYPLGVQQWNYTTNVILGDLPSISSDNAPKKIWFGYTFRTPNNKYMLQRNGQTVDGFNANFRYTNSTVWDSQYPESSLKVFKNCTPIALSTNDGQKNESYYYPNPVKDILTLKNAKIKTIELFDVVGKKINVKVQGNTLDLSKLKSGIYLLNFVGENNKVHVEKIIKI